MAKTVKAGKAPRLPKKIAGVKLSKKLRKGGDRLIAKANTPKGREVIAAGLAIAATAAAATARAKSPARAPHLGDAESASGHCETGVDPGQVVDALSAAASAFMSGLLGRKG